MARKKDIHPNKLKGLEMGKWKKGQSGNPLGRPPGIPSLKDRLAKYLEMTVPEQLPDGKIEKIPVMERIVLALIAKGATGDIPAIKEILDRYYGKEIEKVNISTQEEATISMEERIKKYAPRID